MGIIDLNIQKPAWKRTEVPETSEEAESVVTENQPEVETESRGGFSRTTRAAGALAVGVVGLLALRKLRNRRRVKSSSDDSSE